MPEPRHYTRRKRSRRRKAFTFWWPAVLILLLQGFLWLRIPRLAANIPRPRPNPPALPAATIAYYSSPEGAFTNSVAVRLLRPHLVSLGHRRDRLETDTAFTARKLPPPPYTSPDYTLGSALSTPPLQPFTPPEIRLPGCLPPPDPPPPSPPPASERCRVTLPAALQAAGFTFTLPSNTPPATSGQIEFAVELDASGRPVHILRQRPLRRSPEWATALETALRTGKGNAEARGRIRIEWISSDPAADPIRIEPDPASTL